MERVTRKHFRPENSIKLIKEDVLLKMYDKLAEYEDLEEQGLLLKLPCKVGDVVYGFDYPRSDIVVISEEEIEEIHIREKELVVETDCDFYRCKDFGKTVFLTRTEAEETLRRMEGEK